MFNCPKCKSPFEKGEKACNVCGYDIEKGFIYDPICPRCGRKYIDGTRFCEDDGVKLIPFEKFIPRCALCRRPFTPDVTVCPYDGGPIRPIIGGQKRHRGFTQYNTQPAYFSEKEGYIYTKAPATTRFEAALTDGWFGSLFSAPFMLVIIILLAIRPAGAWIIYDLLIVFLFILSGLASLGYSLIKDGLNNGQSWGKKRAGLMVVDLETNMPCTLKKSVWRNLFFIFPFIGPWEYLKILSHPKGQREGDLYCNTQVIEIDQYAPDLNKQAGKENYNKLYNSAQGLSWE